MRSQPRLPPRIPPLVFGGRQPHEFADADQMSEVLTRAGTAVTVYRPANRDTPFLSRAATLGAGKARLVAATSSPVQFEADGASIGILIIPFHGMTKTRCEGRTMEWAASRTAVFLPPGGCRGHSSARSVVGIDMEPGMLGDMLRGMLGEERGAVREPIPDCSTPRALNLVLGGMDFSQLLFQHMAVMDAMSCDRERILRSGLDDAVLRAALFLLHPELFFAERPAPAVNARGLNLACDYIDAHLSGRVTLSDLERVSGLSGRSLQYAFRATFNRTPMQWVTERRLERVRELILQARPGATLTAIAGDYFSNLGDFSRLYRARYGELPSQTLQNALARRLRT